MEIPCRQQLSRGPEGFMAGSDVGPPFYTAALRLGSAKERREPPLDWTGVFPESVARSPVSEHLSCKIVALFRMIRYARIRYTFLAELFVGPLSLLNLKKIR